MAENCQRHCQSVQVSKQWTRRQAPKVAWKLVYFRSIQKGDIPRDSVRISSCVEIYVHESLRGKATRLGIVRRGERLDVNIVRTIGVEFDRYVSRKIEVRV